MRILPALLSLCLSLATSAADATAGVTPLLWAAAQPKPEQPGQTPSSAFVKAGQRALKRAGYDPGAIDGKMGPATRGALRRFQEAHGLSVTGDFDVPTLTQLLDGSSPR